MNCPARAPATTLMVCVIGSVVLSGCAPTSPQPQELPTQPPVTLPMTVSPTATLPDGTTLQLELALTKEEQETGLRFRPELPPDTGMLIVLEKRGFPSLWMKDMSVPLDILFLDEQGSIVDLALNAPPCAAEPCPRYKPRGPILAVLELAGGVASQHQLEPGVRIEFSHVAGYPEDAQGQAAGAT